MGLRGPGARRLTDARAAAPERRRRMPWEAKGLTRAGRVIKFVQYCPVTKGKRAGRKMKLLPGQRAFLEDLYGRPDSKRVRIAVKSEPRGNGKTGLLASLILCHLIGPEAEPRGEVYAAAVDRTQSGKMFDEVEAIILAVPAFAELVNIQRFHKKIEVLSGQGAGSIFEAMSADARKGHGLAPSLWVFDELARVPSRDLLDTLMTAQGKRNRSLGIIISTQAADDEHALSQIIDDGLSGADPSVLVHLTAAPDDADPFDPETLRAVNPAIGIFLDEADLLAEQQRAKRLPSFAPAFINLRLNRRVDSRAEDRIINIGVWKECMGTVDRASLRGRRCFGGLDLSGRNDLSALVLVFPSTGSDPSFDILPFAWTPAGAMEDRTAVERERLRQWIRDGHLTEVPGPTIRYGYIAAALARLAQEFDIRAIGYDRWRIDDLKYELVDIGCNVPLQEFGQGFKDMSPAIERFAELALSGKLRHGSNPVLNAAVAGAITVTDPAENIKVDKEKSNSRGPVRIDPLAALIMAIGTAARFVEPPKRDLSGFLSKPIMVV